VRLARLALGVLTPTRMGDVFRINNIIGKTVLTVSVIFQKGNIGANKSSTMVLLKL